MQYLITQEEKDSLISMGEYKALERMFDRKDMCLDALQVAVNDSPDRENIMAKYLAGIANMKYRGQIQLDFVRALALMATAMETKASKDGLETKRNKDGLPAHHAHCVECLARLSEAWHDWEEDTK